MNNEQTIHRTRIKNDFRSNFWRFDGEKTIIIDYNLTSEVLLVLKSWQMSLARFHRSFHLLHCCWILFLWSFYYPVGFLIFVFQAPLSCRHFSARQQFSWHYRFVAVMNLDQTSLQRFNRLSIYSLITEWVYCKGRYSRRNHVWTVSSVSGSCWMWHCLIYFCYKKGTWPEITLFAGECTHGIESQGTEKFY